MKSVEHRGPELLARLDRIPAWALPRRYIAIIGLGYFFVFFDIANIGFALPAIAKEFELSSAESLFVAVAVGLVGYVVGSLGIGSLADRFGRYRMLVVTMTLTALGSFGDAAAQGLTSLIAFRFITGVGVGADLNLVSTYVSELAPARLRGRISVLTFLVGIVGQAVTPFIALALVPNFSFGWRLLFAVGGVIALLGFAVRLTLPESPRWQAQHGHYDEAERTVVRMENACRARGVALPEPEPVAKTAGPPGHSVTVLMRAPYAGRLAVFISMWFLWYIGNYGFLGDAAQLINERGAEIGGSILYLAIGAIGYPVGAIIMLRVVDRVERRLLILGSTVVWCLGMLAVGYASTAAIIVGAFLAAVALGSYLQVAYTFTAESFPTSARATGFALSDGIGHAGGALGAIGLPMVVSSWSFFSGFALIGVTGLLAGLVALLGPAATGRRLEHVSA